MPTATTDVRNFIGGEFVTPAQTEEVISPGTGEVIGHAPVSTPEEVDAAVRAARSAFRGWASTSPRRRSEAIHALADAIEEHGDEFAAIEIADVGKTTSQMAEEVEAAVDHLRFFAGAARNLEGKASMEYLEGFTSIIRREPVGVAAQITPWNYPLILATWKLGASLAAGCTSVLKPAEITPLSTFRLAELAADILPKGVLNVVGGHGDGAGAALVTHPDVDVVSATGSSQTGRWIAEHAGRDLKRTHLELGGNAAVIIFDDYDPDLALDFITETALYNAGQDCTAPSRILASSRVYDDVVAGLSERASKAVVGDVTDPNTTLGPIVSERQRERVAGLVDRKADRAEVVTGGSAPDRPGFYYEPTVIANLEQDDELSQTETFGPVMTVQRFTDEDEAVRWANGQAFGLSSSVWTRDTGRAFRVANALEVGIVWINCHIVGSSEMPHGGRKQSGWGKDMSAYAIDAYTDVKHVMLNLELN